MNFYYRLLNLQGQEIADRFSETDVENPWQERFDKHGIVLGYKILECRIEKQNIDAELITAQAVKDAKDAAKLAAKDANKALKAVKDSTDVASLKLACRDLAKVVHALVKALDIVDPTEGE